MKKLFTVVGLTGGFMFAVSYLRTVWKLTLKKVYLKGKSDGLDEAVKIVENNTTKNVQNDSEEQV